MPACWLGVMAIAELCSSSRSASGVEKCSLLGGGPATDAGALVPGCASPALRSPVCDGGVLLKKELIGGEPLIPAPLHLFRKFDVVMMRCCPSR